MEPVCHVEGRGGARSLVCTPHTHVHTVPTAQIHTRARTVMHMPTQHTRAHTRGDGAPPHRPHRQPWGWRGQWGQAGLAPEPITFLEEGVQECFPEEVA